MQAAIRATLARMAASWHQLDRPPDGGGPANLGLACVEVSAVGGGAGAPPLRALGPVALGGRIRAALWLVQQLGGRWSGNVRACRGVASYSLVVAVKMLRLPKSNDVAWKLVIIFPERTHTLRSKLCVPPLAPMVV